MIAYAFLPGLFSLSLASALVGGVFLTFSDFVMRSLAAAPAAAGIESMQLINRKVYRSVFMVLLMSILPAAALASLASWTLLGSGIAGWVIAGTVAYAIGVMGVTIRGNVPMNMRLDAMPVADAATSTYWTHYVSSWTGWNHVRVLASILASIAFAMAAMQIATTL